MSNYKVMDIEEEDLPPPPPPDAVNLYRDGEIGVLISHMHCLVD